MERAPRDPTGERRWRRHLVVEAIVAHPIDAVFPYLCEPEKWHDFAPAVDYRERIDPGPVDVGSRWKGTDRIGPFRIHFVDRLDALDDRRVVWLSSAPWNARVEYACEPEGDRTRIRADYDGVLSGSLRWQVGWLPLWGWWIVLARDFRRLDRLLTRRRRAASRWAPRDAVDASLSATADTRGSASH